MNEPLKPISRRVLVVDDETTIRDLFRAILADRYEIETAGSGKEALRCVRVWQPDLVLLDIMMPGIAGYETCRALKLSRPTAPQVIVVSARTSLDEQALAFEAGADDYLAKPVVPCDLRSRVQLHMQVRESQENTVRLQRIIEADHAALRRTATERTQHVAAVQDVAVFALAKVAESRDNETGQHLLRLREYAQILARELAYDGPYAAAIDDEFLANLYRSSPLHDIGKVGILDKILLKPGRLTKVEFEVMKTHTKLGADILQEAVMQLKAGGFLAMAAQIARFHHERWDGKGYPAGLAAGDIPLPARIVAVADVYDALTSERPYKSAWTPERAKRTIEEAQGTQFDPVIVAAFQRRFDDFLEIQRQHIDRQPARLDRNSARRLRCNSSRVRHATTAK